MPTFQIICLANSIKRGGRCIAGLKTDGSGWLRPVSRKDDGTLDLPDYILDNYQEPQLFDIIEIECTHPSPEIHQPENWVISQKRWKFVGRPTRQMLRDVVNPEIQRNVLSSELFGNHSDRVDYELMQQNPVQKSLAFIKPTRIIWNIKEDAEGRKKYRVEFYLHNSRYNLSVTDPNWRAALENLPHGSNYAANNVAQTNQGDIFLFTVSLGEPFQPNRQNKSFCYKLVAAVINATQLVNQLK
ncbi:hypothetical protein [[Phormidium] sp. ETS-05]|uniref:dual OB domain-containing protein n=1 Tax=[Phormidium] sp. ETS-05 TaxID=222819 RepID=UPI0018EF06AD|nr:hypothetical protein [[Phormidium] sp. ETS-05]